MQQTFVAGATAATSASDYSLLLSTAATDPETVARVVATGRADGVILMETLVHDARVERLQADGHPYVLIGRTHDMTGISYVDMDFGDAVETSLAHLARLGHTQVALFNFPPDLIEAGYTSSLIARDVFERRASDFGIDGIHIPCSTNRARRSRSLRGCCGRSRSARPPSRPAGSSQDCSARCGRPSSTSLTISRSCQ